jgi:hypothetical protein
MNVLAITKGSYALIDKYCEWVERVVRHQWQHTATMIPWEAPNHTFCKIVSSSISKSWLVTHLVKLAHQAGIFQFKMKERLWPIVQCEYKLLDTIFTSEDAKYNWWQSKYLVPDTFYCWVM